MAERHLGSKSTVPEGSSVDLDDIIAKNPCHVLYMALEECLVETNRNWKSCQMQVKHNMDSMFFSSLTLFHSAD